jgi:hypothetical protein
MTIRMWCDHCGEEVPADTNGGVRVRTGNREIKLHLCPKDQQGLRELIASFANGKTVEVSPSLKRS